MGAMNQRGYMKITLRSDLHDRENNEILFWIYRWDCSKSNIAYDCSRSTTSLIVSHWRHMMSDISVNICAGSDFLPLSDRAVSWTNVLWITH